MISSILVVCVGNICRSPVGERLLREALPQMNITSAGIGAVVGAGADNTATSVAKENGLSLDCHIARAFVAEEAAKQDLILVMEPGHKREIIKMGPHLQGRTMLFDQWTTATGIQDPHRKPRVIHEHVFRQLKAASDAWVIRLGGKKEETS
jgi:protein-tyrosine phosphatase